MADHIVTIDSVVQRDTLASYLTDIKFSVYDADGDDLELEEVSFSDGPAGPFTDAAPQVVDRRYDVPVPITGVPLVAPGDQYNFVWQPFFDLANGTHTNVYIRIIVKQNLAPFDEVTVDAGPFTISTEEADQPDSPLERQLKRLAAISRSPKDFIGSGLVIPFRRGSSDFVSGVGIQLIRSSVRQILSTNAAFADMPGELPWRQNFGNKMWVLKHSNNNDFLRARARQFVEEALLWEPRVLVTEVLVEEEEDIDEGNTLRVRVRYTLEDVNIEDNNSLFQNEFEESVVLGRT